MNHYHIKSNNEIFTIVFDSSPKYVLTVIINTADSLDLQMHILYNNNKSRPGIVDPGAPRGNDSIQKVKNKRVKYE